MNKKIIGSIFILTSVLCVCALYFLYRTNSISEFVDSNTYSFYKLGEISLGNDRHWWFINQNLSCSTQDGKSHNVCDLTDIINRGATHLYLNSDNRIYSIRDAHLVNSQNSTTYSNGNPVTASTSSGSSFVYGLYTTSPPSPIPPPQPIVSSGYLFRAITNGLNLNVPGIKLDNNLLKISNGRPISTWNVPNPTGLYIKSDAFYPYNYLFYIFKVAPSTGYTWNGYFVDSNKNPVATPFKGNINLGTFSIGTFL